MMLVYRVVHCDRSSVQSAPYALPVMKRINPLESLLAPLLELLEVVAARHIFLFARLKVRLIPASAFEAEPGSRDSLL